MKRMLLTAVTVIAMALVACNPFSSDDDDDKSVEMTVENYWPLAVGNSWTLNNFEDGTATNSIMLSILAKDGDWYTMAMGEVGRAEGDTMLVGHVSGTIVVKGNMNDPDPWTLVAEPLTAGATFPASTTDNGRGRIVSIDSTLVTPAGTFTDVVVVTEYDPDETTDPNALGEVWYFAPGAGLIGMANYDYDSTSSSYIQKTHSVLASNQIN